MRRQQVIDNPHAASIKDVLLMCRLVLVVGFLLSLMWENTQGPLFRGYSGFLAHFWVCFVASVVDALVMLLLYMMFALFTHDLFWPQKPKLWHNLMLFFIGGLLAVWFEKWAQNAEQWSYASTMPRVPVLHAGLAPVLQLMVLPYITFRISTYVGNVKLKNNKM